MTARAVVFGVLALTCFACLAPARASELPPERVATYVIHEVPSDPNSAVTMTINLSLRAQDAHDLAVGWEVASIEFRAPAASGVGDSVWVAVQPALETPDGLWWVEHADPLLPLASEFAQSPHFTGTATATEQAEQDLLYDFEGSSYSIPYPYLDPYPITGGLDYAFAVVEEPEPVTGGIDEPVEIPEDAESGSVDP